VRYPAKFFDQSGGVQPLRLNLIEHLQTEFSLALAEGRAQIVRHAFTYL